MKQIVNAFDSLPMIAKLILALPALDIVWVLYRIAKSIDENNSTGIVLGIVLLIIGFPFLWLIDMICVAVNNTVWWF